MLKHFLFCCSIFFALNSMELQDIKYDYQQPNANSSLSKRAIPPILCINPASKQCAAVHDKEIQFWDLENLEKPLGTHKLLFDTLCIKFAPTGTYLAVAQPSFICLLTQTGDILRDSNRKSITFSTITSSSANDLCFNDANTILAASFNDNTLVAWDTITRKRLVAFSPYDATISTLCFNKYNNLVICTQEPNLVFWHVDRNNWKNNALLKSLKITTTIERPLLIVQAGTRSNNTTDFRAGFIALFIANQKLLNIYMLDTGQQVDSIAILIDNVTKLRISNNGRYLIFLTPTKWFLVDRINKCAVYMKLIMFDDEIADADFTPDNKMLIIINNNGILQSRVLQSLSWDINV